MTTCNKCLGLNNAGFMNHKEGDTIRAHKKWWVITKASDRSCFAREQGGTTVRLIYYQDIDAPKANATK
jgi:hypothetical protein